MRGRIGRKGFDWGGIVIWVRGERGSTRREAGKVWAFDPRPTVVPWVRSRNPQHPGHRPSAAWGHAAGHAPATACPRGEAGDGCSRLIAPPQPATASGRARAPSREARRFARPRERAIRGHRRRPGQLLSADEPGRMAALGGPRRGRREHPRAGAGGPEGDDRRGVGGLQSHPAERTCDPARRSHPALAGPLECNRWDDGVDDQPKLEVKPVRSADDFVRWCRPVTGWCFSSGPKSRCNARARSPMKPSPASWTCTRKAAGAPASRLAGARPEDRKAGSAGRAREARSATNRWGRGRRPSAKGARRGSGPRRA